MIDRVKSIFGRGDVSIYVLDSKDGFFHQQIINYV